MRVHSLSTLAVQAGQRAAGREFTPSCVPIHNAVTYTYPGMARLDRILAGEESGYVYSRFANPTVAALEDAVAQLEGTEAALACASGMAAIHLALLACGVSAGEHILAAQDLYGGTSALLQNVLSAADVRSEFVDMTDLEAVEAALRIHHPVAVLVETMSNPLLKVVDVPKLAQLSHAAGARCIVDNTFATPCMFRPALHGADYVVHSATKYLGGHGDVLAGVVAGSHDGCSKARELQKLMGNVLGPNEAWLLLRGMRTLVLRVRQQCENAAAAARFLDTHPQVKKVYYPGLTSHPQFALCRRLFAANLHGAVLSFEIAGAAKSEVFRFMDALRIVSPATSLGDIASLILYPAHSSHRSLSQDQRERAGITETLLRLSLGIEEASDVVADLNRAFGAIA
jgi:cystathionine gamma-synthase/methionine-gamma-lyase